MTKLSLVTILMEISRWKRENFNSDSLLDVLKRAAKESPGQLFAHFTNEPKKLSFNPKSNGEHINPLGFYGFPIDEDFLSYPNSAWSGKNYVIIFKPKDGVQIIKATPENKQKRDVSLAKSANDFIKQGIGGMYSDNRTMSGDIEKELVLFNGEKDAQVIAIFPNTLINDLKAQQFVGNIKNVGPNKLQRFQQYQNVNHYPVRNTFSSDEEYEKAVWDYQDAQAYFRNKSAADHFTSNARTDRKKNRL